MKVIETLKEEAAKYGAEFSRDDRALMIDAPAGKIWKCSDTHCLVASCENRGGQTWYIEAVRDLTERMAHGLEDCAEQDCDICEGY
jgi:hypothetical protein